MRTWFTIGLTLLLGVLLLGCSSTPKVREPYVPHPQQEAWVDEASVINLVTRLVYDHQFESRQHQAEERYAAMLRYWYQVTSRNGTDKDGGIRALNFIRKIHVDANGSRDFWRDVVELASHPVPGQKGMPLPEDFK